MSEFFVNEDDYNDIFTSPSEAAEIMEVEEGKTFSLLRIEVVSRTTYKVQGGDVIPQSISFPQDGLEG